MKSKMINVSPVLKGKKKLRDSQHAKYELMRDNQQAQDGDVR